MSIQLGTAPLPPARSSAAWPRLKRALQALANDPNPIFLRELRQAARLTRTPVILAVVTSMMTLLIASIGGALSVGTEPAQVGIGVFHTFFSLAFAVVSWVGPAVAAATVASERSGRTWETLQLTGLSPQRIARGKFLAALTYVVLYVVMLAPVGALSFLFGGVTPSEVLLSFVLLLLIAALAVAFGLAMSSKLASPAVSVLVTLLVAVPVSLFSYLLGGVALSFAAHELWPAVAGGPPVWLPTAYVRADFSLSYWVFLVLFPMVGTILPAWLLYEITIANMASPSDDRSTRLRIWLLVSAPVLTIAVGLAGLARQKIDWFVAGLSVCWIFFVFSSFLVIGEPLGPSRRVQARWSRLGNNRWRRLLGPSVGLAAGTSALLALCCLSALMVAGLSVAASADDRYALLGFGGYALGFSLFTSGFAAWWRARARGNSAPRLLLAAVLFIAILGPNIVMAVGGLFYTAQPRMLMLAAPSPAFAFFVVERLRAAGGDADLYLLAASAAAAGWGLIGSGLLVAGSLRARARHRLAESQSEPASPVASTESLA